MSVPKNVAGLALWVLAPRNVALGDTHILCGDADVSIEPFSSGSMR